MCKDLLILLVCNFCFLLQYLPCYISPFVKRFQNLLKLLSKIFVVDGVQLNLEILKLKLDKWNLVYTFELKKEQEAEIQRSIREQMAEEEKVRKEIERQKAKIEKDQAQHNNEMKRLMQYMQNSNDSAEKQLYIDKIRELEERLRQLESEKNTVLEREANAKAGYVYIISNIGSFGEDIYKIGMTRRLEPMDRVKELSSASVPFEFDVHAMIFSDDAPALEHALHKHFQNQRVNLVNLRKEFFHVSIDEIEDVVKKQFNNTAVFTKIPGAREYYETLSLRVS
ncbi:MAG: GIY-YIG nuclease family protein [Lachnospiraceae bacterium]|nr:GIY-YIG nuclease family protein [Lachnospiraceae bacterium]